MDCYQVWGGLGLETEVLEISTIALLIPSPILPGSPEAALKKVLPLKKVLR